MWLAWSPVTVLGAAPKEVPQETAAESTQDRFTSMQELSLEKGLVRPLAAPVDLAQGPERLHLEGGYLVPVFSGKLAGEWEETVDQWLAKQDPAAVPRAPSEDERGRQEIVGWIWSGGVGRITLDLPDRADALVLANRMVTLGADPASLAAFAHRTAPLPVTVTSAIVLGIDPHLAEIYAGPNHPDPYEIVVVGVKEADEARRRAADLLRRRSAVWTELEKEPGDRIAWDRIAHERGAIGAADGLAFWDLQTETRFGLVAPQLGGDVDQDLTVVTDLTGRWDPRRLVRVASWGLSPGGPAVDGLIGGVPNPPSDPKDPTSAPLPPLRVDPVKAESTVAVQPEPNGLLLDVSVDSVLTFRAVGPGTWIDLVLPKMEAAAGSFEIVSAELADGTPLLGRAPERREAKAAPDPKPGPGPAPQPDPGPRVPEPPPEPGTAEVRLQLPAVVPDGGEITVHLVHRDTWPYANFVEVSGDVMSLGQSSGMQGFLPTVPPHDLGSPWSFVARVAVPDGGKLMAAVSGRTTREWSERGWHLTETDSEGSTAYFPEIAVGRFTASDDPAQLGFPAIRVRTLGTHWGTVDQFGPEVRRVLQVYQGFLPPYPVSELEVFEGPSGLLSGVWVAPYGMVDLQSSWVDLELQRNPSDTPHLESGVFAHELAHQYFGHLAPPASVEDFWISESYSELFSCLYVAAAFGGEDCDERMAFKRREWEGQPPAPAASLTRAYDDPATEPAVVYDYGPYVLLHLLKNRLGTEPFYAATDALLRDHAHEPLTTERLQAYYEAASGKDLDDFFAFWVYGGYVPHLALTWSSKGGHLVGQVRSDVAFGTFDVPVVAKIKGADPVGAWVTVRDGVGPLDLGVTGKVESVELDPGGVVLAGARDARQASKKGGP